MGSIPSKVVGGKTYVQVESLPRLDPDRGARVAVAERLAQVERQTQFNLVRLDDEGPCVALLNYPAFADEAFPALRESWLVDLDGVGSGYV
jgi:hypothetical protein